MKIHTGDEWPVPCSCGKPAWAREIMIRSETHGRRVGYASHADCLTHPDHGGRLEHLKEFFRKLDGLTASLKAECREGGKLDLKQGSIVEVDLGYVLPDACSDYTEAVPEITVRWNGRNSVFQMGKIEVESVNMDDLLALIKSTAEITIGSLKQHFETGKF